MMKRSNIIEVSLTCLSILYWWRSLSMLRFEKMGWHIGLNIACIVISIITFLLLLNHAKVHNKKRSWNDYGSVILSAWCCSTISTGIVGIIIVVACETTWDYILYIIYMAPVACILPSIIGTMLYCYDGKCGMEFNQVQDLLETEDEHHEGKN